MFWSALAPVLLPIAFGLIFALIAPGLFRATFDPALADQGAVARQWQFQAAVLLLMFWAMTGWSRSIGAGVLSGPSQVSPGWVVGAALLGPIVLQGSVIFVGAVTGQTGAGWIFAEGEPPAAFETSKVTLVAIVTIVLLAPLVEEIGFRGIGLGWLIGRGLPVPAAIMATSFIFAVIHMQYSGLGMAAVFITGCGLCLIRLASRSMTAPIVAHMSANGLSVLAAITAGGGT